MYDNTYDKALEILRKRTEAAAKRFASAGDKLRDALTDITMCDQIDRADRQYRSTGAKLDAWVDLQYTLEQIDRHGYCYLLAILIARYGKADNIVSHIIRKTADIRREDGLSQHDAAFVGTQHIAMWAINRYSSLLTREDIDECTAWRKSCLTAVRGG